MMTEKNPQNFSFTTLN